MYVITAFCETRDQILAHNLKNRWHLRWPTPRLHLSTNGRLRVSIWRKGFLVTSLLNDVLLHPNEPFPSNMIISSSLWFLFFGTFTVPQISFCIQCTNSWPLLLCYSTKTIQIWFRYCIINLYRGSFLLLFLYFYSLYKNIWVFLVCI